MQSQKERTEEYVKQKYDSLLAASSPADCARLLSCQGPGGWLQHSSHFTTSVEWKIAAQLRVHATLLAMPDVRCRCGAQVVSAHMADHAFLCRKLTGYTAIHRHDGLVIAIMRCLRRHGFLVSRALVGMHEDNRKTDFLITAPAMGGRLSVDVSITHPGAQTTVARAATVPGHAAQQREIAKEEKHGAACRANGYVFKPWVFESFGRWGQCVTHDLETLEDNAADPLLFRADMRRTVAMAIQRGNADMLAHAVVATSRDAVPPLDRPGCRLARARKQLRRSVMLDLAIDSELMAEVFLDEQ